MGLPKIKLLCVSNVFSRLMHFKKSGDVEVGHRHVYDHGTLISSGSVLYEVLDSYDGNVVSSKKVFAPNFIFVEKNKYHRITALEDDTVCACIHALRTNDEELVDPDCLIQKLEDEDTKNLSEKVMLKTGKKLYGVTVEGEKDTIEKKIIKF